MILRLIFAALSAACFLLCVRYVNQRGQGNWWDLRKWKDWG